MGISAALAAAVALPGKGARSSRKGLIKCKNAQTTTTIATPNRLPIFHFFPAVDFLVTVTFDKHSPSQTNLNLKLAFVLSKG